MDKYNKPYLEKYSGRSSRHECPSCGDPSSFVYYLDGNTGEPIDKVVGRCNHESSCGYHYTPKEFFARHPELKGDKTVFTPIKKTVTERKPIGYIPFKYVTGSLSYKSGFVRFLCGLFDRDTLESPSIEKMMAKYAIGATRNENIIFWQIDINGRVRTGRILKFDPDTGHRFRGIGGTNWVHAVMKKKGLLPIDFNLKQCLFGEHLLRIYPNYPVAVVEAEKTAVIASMVYDNYVWLATGGKSQMQPERLQVLSGRNVVLFPDTDGFTEWTKKAEELERFGLKFRVSDILEKNATDEEKAAKIDIADWIINQLSETVTRGKDARKVDMINYFNNINPLFDRLVKDFDLALVD